MNKEFCIKFGKLNKSQFTGLARDQCEERCQDLRIIEPEFLLFALP